VHACWVGGASGEDDVVHFTVEKVRWEVDEFVDAFPVIVFFTAVEAKGVGAEVLDGKNARAGGVD
jgi:hypothetical protein